MRGIHRLSVYSPRKGSVMRTGFAYRDIIIFIRLFWKQWHARRWWNNFLDDVNGLVQDCSISIANVLEILQSCTEPSICVVPDSKVHGANMGPTCVLSAPDGLHAGPMNLAIRGYYWQVPGSFTYPFCLQKLYFLQFHNADKVLNDLY